MPPRLIARSASRIYRHRSTASPAIPLHQRRCFADEKSAAERPLEHNVHNSQEPKGPNMEQLPHVSEEAAAMSKVKGEQGPEVEQQGTPIDEVADGDKEMEKHLPKVMKDGLKKKPGEPGSRSYSTLARRPFRPISSTRSFSTSRRLAISVEQEYSMSDRPSWVPATARAQEEAEEVDEDEEMDEEFDDDDVEYDPDEDELEGPGVLAQQHKFGMPVGRLPPNSHLHDRYDPLVDQVTNLLMKDGKKATAQKNMSTIFAHLATTPAPRPSGTYPLLLNGLAPSSLPLNPPLYLSIAIDSVAPLFRIRQQKGAAGGGLALQIPVPLRIRQRRRTAVMWMLDQVDKKKGGTSPFAKRFAEEVIAIVEGRSSVWERRVAMHGLSIRSRVNIGNMSGRRR